MGDNRQLSDKESKEQTRPGPEKHYVYSCFHDGSAGKESTCSAGDTRDMGSIPGSERSPGEGNGNPLQYTCLGNPMEADGL